MSTTKIQTWVTRFLVAEDGPTIVEYAVLLAVIAGTMIATITLVGFEIQGLSEDTQQALDSALN